MRNAVIFVIAAAFAAAVFGVSAPAAAQEGDADQPWEQEKKKEQKGRNVPAAATEDEGAGQSGEGAGEEKPKEAAKPATGADKEQKKDAKKEKGKKEKDEAASGAAPKGFKGPVVEETHDYIRCKDDVYQKFLQAREEYSALKRQQTNLLSLIDRERKTLDQIRGLSDDEIEADVRAMQVGSLQKTIDDAQDKLKKLEPRLMEKRISYEPLRSKCED